MTSVIETILVVDDEPQITRVLRTALAGHGYNVRTASAGDEALEITHRTLLASVWGEMSTQQPEYLHVFMNHQRKKPQSEDTRCDR